MPVLTLTKEPLTVNIIVTYSAKVKQKMEEVFKLEGAKGYLVKPVDPVKLIQKIEECLGSDE